MFGSYYYGAFIAGTSIFGLQIPESFDPTSDGGLSPITLNSGGLEEHNDINAGSYDVSKIGEGELIGLDYGGISEYSKHIIGGS